METVRRDLLVPLAAAVRRERAVVVTGSRQAGKTTLCRDLLPSAMGGECDYVSFDDPEERHRFLRAPVQTLDSFRSPLVVLDEVQKIPAMFDPLKFVIDRKSPSPPKFVLTGSSQLLLMDRIRETMAGRTALLHLHPLSLHESTGSETPSFLSRLWDAGAIRKTEVDRFKALSPALVRKITAVADEHRKWGGFPPLLHRPDESTRLSWLRDYRKTYLERDVADVGQVADIDAFALAQKLLCARTGQILSQSEVARDLGVAPNTVKRYLGLLRMTFQCALLPPWFENVGKRLVKSPKIHFPDPGLVRAILGDMSVSQGALYESWIFGELTKWKELQAVEPEIYYYRTQAGLEIDFLLAGNNGRLLPVEAKSAARIKSADGRTLETFLGEHPRAAKVGLVVYPGREMAEIRRNVWAVPDWWLLAG